jgi:hypothetical protein
LHQDCHLHVGHIPTPRVSAVALGRSAIRSAAVPPA